MIAILEKLKSRIRPAPEYRCLSEEQIASFEEDHNITLPEQYRECLLHVSNGTEGIFRLGEIDSGFDVANWEEGDEMVGTLSEPFPYTSEWNDLSEMPNDDFDQEDVQALAQWEAAREPFEARYWAALDGAIPIAHLGC